MIDENLELNNNNIKNEEDDNNFESSITEYKEEEFKEEEILNKFSEKKLPFEERFSQSLNVNSNSINF